MELLHHKLEDNSNQKNLDKNLQLLGELQEEFEHLGGYSLKNKTEAALSGLGFKADDFHNQFKSFSGGWQMRAELARVLVASPDILLLDEPSNYLDLPAIEWLKKSLKEYQGTVLLISHDRYLLNSLANITVEVQNGKLTRYQGNYDYYIKEREQRYITAIAAKKNQDRKKDEIERFVRKFRAKSTKASQVQSRLKQLEKMEDVQAPDSGPNLSKIRIADPPHCGSHIISLEDIGLTYDNERWIFRNVNLEINRGDKIALVGYNGMGKTTLLRIIADKLNQSAGKKKLGHKVVVGYQSQEFAETMPPDQTALNVVKNAGNGKMERDVRAALGSFGFSGESVNKKVEYLSGGEKIRLAFARIFVNPPNFLLLDEPTTHLDINGRKALEESLKKYKGTICFVSHDVTFVRHLAETIVSITGNGVNRFAGGYDYYKEKTDVNIETIPSVEIKEKPKQKNSQLSREQRKDINRKINKLKKIISRAEKKVESLEKEKNTLTEEIESAKTHDDYEIITSKMKNIEMDIMKYLDEWETAEQQLEEVDK
jgi:ATP-binding cassette subfamily F protein 3